VIYKTPYGTWRVKVKFRSVVVADRTFDRKGDALRWELEEKRLLQSGEYVSPAAGWITVRELADEYTDSRQGQVSVRAWESDESALRVQIVPAFGKVPISSVSSVQIEQFLTELAVSRSVRTAARVRTTLRGLFRYAVRTRRLAQSAAESVPLPHPDSRTGKVVEVQSFPLEVLLDVVATQQEIAGRYGDVTLVLALTGIRFGELRGLRVRDVVGLPDPGLVVKRSVPQSGRTGAVIERATTKSGRSRLVPLTDRLRPVVESWAEGREPDDFSNRVHRCGEPWNAGPSSAISAPRQSACPRRYLTPPPTRQSRAFRGRLLGFGAWSAGGRCRGLGEIGVLRVKPCGGRGAFLDCCRVRRVPYRDLGVLDELVGPPIEDP